MLKSSGGSPKCVSKQHVQTTSLSNSLIKSTRQASLKVGLLKSSVHFVLQKNLRLHAYKIQNIQHIQSNNKPNRLELARHMLQVIENDSQFLNRIFSLMMKHIIQPAMPIEYGDQKIPIMWGSLFMTNQMWMFGAACLMMSLLVLFFLWKDGTMRSLSRICWNNLLSPNFTICTQWLIFKRTVTRRIGVYTPVKH